MSIDILLLQKLQEAKSVENQHKKEVESSKLDVAAYSFLTGAHKALTTSVTSNTSLSVSLAVDEPKSPGLRSSAPSFPGTSGAGPDPSIPSSDATNFNGTGYLDKLKDFLSYLKNHPTDLHALQNFMLYLNNLSKAGLLDTPETQALLGSADISQMIAFALKQAMELAYFQGFDGVMGEDGAKNFLQNLLNSLSGTKDPTIQKMIDSIHGLLGYLPTFEADHHQHGKYIWTIGGKTYEWNDADDQEIILERIFNDGVKGAPNDYYDQFNLNGFMAEYRMMALEDLLKRFKNPEIVLALWLMSTYDKQYQDQESGLAGVTDLLSKMTNKYGTPLLTLAQSIQDMTPDQAAQFMKLFDDSSSLVEIETQLKGISGTWKTNVVDAIRGIKVEYTNSVGNKVSTTMGQVMDEYHQGLISKDELATAFKSLVPAGPTPGGDPSPSTSPGYNTLISALQQGGGLFTSMSKTVSTELSSVAQIDNAVVKFGHSVVDPNGGGFIQLNNAIIRNQKSN